MQAIHAVRATLAIREAVSAYNCDADHDPLQYGIGLHAGPAIVGSMGANGQKRPTVIGETVNVTYALHAQARSGQILISPAIYERVRDAVVVEKREPLMGRGGVVMDHTYLLLGLSQED
jgi:adenylate cyclase